MASKLVVIGSEAPDFTLPATNGESVTLSDSRGKENVLLAFFPMAFTGTCTAEMCEFTEDYSEYEARGVRVMPISVDSIPTLKEFKAKESIGVDLLSDFHREVARKYGVLLEEHFFAMRAYVLIDKAGKVSWALAEPDPSKKRDTATILSHLEALG